MKRNGSHLRQYLPWLGLLLGVDALAVLLLWLADARAFAAMTAVIVLATVFLFAGVCAVLCARSKRREQAFTAFLTTPDAAHEQALCRLLSPAESRSAHLLGETLRSCIDEVLDDYRPLLEEKHFRVELRLADETVFSDRRGLCFLLGQVVSNSVKYALEKPVLTFSLENGGTATVLSIRDNGPGVRACDLPYVFEKGFTGDSGHEKNKATGMGLYLAREVAKDLGLTLTAASDWGAGFAVRVSFPVVEE